MADPSWVVLDEEAGLWGLERCEDGVCVLRSVALRLADGGTVVVGPLPGAPGAALDALADLGRPAFLLAPNHFHNLGIPAWQARLAPVEAVASEGARPRVARKTGCTIGPLDPLRAALPPHVELVEPPGTRTGEVWLEVRSARGITWVVGDAFFHLPRVPRSTMGRLSWLLGAAPGLRIGTTFRLLALADAAAYGRWIRQRLEASPPDRLVPAHGEVLEGEALAHSLRALVDARLPG